MPGRVGDGHVARAVSPHQPRHAEAGVGPENLGVEEVVVNPTVDHVHPLQPVGGAHENAIVQHRKVAALHELNPHLLREERVLEVGRVEHPRRQHHRQRVLHLPGGALEKRSEKLLRVLFDGGDRLAVEEVREAPLHHLAVLQHVGNPRGAPHVVFKDVDLTVVIPHQVDAAHVAPGLVRGAETLHLGPERLGAHDELARDDVVVKDPLLVVDVVDEQVQCGDPLPETGVDPGPLVVFDDPRHDVERPDLLYTVFVAVDVECDAGVPHLEVRGVLAPAELLHSERFETVDKVVARRAWTALVVEGFVVG